MPPFGDACEVEEKEFATDILFDAELGFFGDIEAGVIGEGIDEGGDDGEIAAAAEEEGGAEADLPGEVGVFEEGDELGGLMVERAGGIGEEEGDVDEEYEEGRYDREDGFFDRGRG